jgi:hypothetical protein
MRTTMCNNIVIPAQAGIQFCLCGDARLENWMPAYAGMTA